MPAFRAHALAVPKPFDPPFKMKKDAKPRAPQLTMKKKVKTNTKSHGKDAQRSKEAPNYKNASVRIGSKDSLPIVLIKRLLQKLPTTTFTKLRKHINKLKVLTICSQCTGSNVVYFMVNKLMSVINSKTKVYEKFACETNQAKLDWIAFLTRELQGHEACAYSNINAISEKHAECSTHGKTCIIPSTFLSSCGFSCKNFSRCVNVHKSEASSSYSTRQQFLQSILKEGRGSSGDTCQGMLKFLDAHRPKYHIWENVDDLMNGANEGNLDFLLEALETVGYACTCEVLDAQYYGVPQA